MKALLVLMILLILVSCGPVRNPYVPETENDLLAMKVVARTHNLIIYTVEIENKDYVIVQSLIQGDVSICQVQ